MSSASEIGISVRELAALPQFRLRVLAGAAGLDKQISWAHVVDHPSPWDWLEPGDLVLTSGWIVPKAPEDQGPFIERLASAGLSGLIVGEDTYVLPLKVPELSESLRLAADRLGFPVLVAHPQTSWVELSRLVVRANAASEGRTLSTIMRIHDTIRTGLMQSRSSAELLAGLSKVIGCSLWVVEQDTWEPLFPDTEVPDAIWREALSRTLTERRGTMSRFIPLKTDDRESLVVTIPIERRVFLFAEGWKTNPPRLALLEHAAAACAMEIARVDSYFDEEWRTGWSLLSQALQGQLDPAAVTAGLEQRGLNPPFLCIAVDASGKVADRIERYWRVRRVPHLLTRIGLVMILVHADEERVEDIRKLSDWEALGAGVSESFIGVSALADASRQARWALETIAPDATGVAEYASGGPSFLPRTMLESQQTIERILGPLLRYDEETDSEMIKTLQIYLDCDRSPKRAAALLNVHTQTVHYRLQRIQELTGRSLSSTADLSEFWLALQARALIQTPPGSAVD